MGVCVGEGRVCVLGGGGRREGVCVGRGWKEGGENKFYSVVLHGVTNFHTCTSYSIDGRAQCMEG